MEDKALEVAKQAALEAGKFLQENFGGQHPYLYKSDGSQSIEADVKAEEIIVGRIKKAFPDHAILAEESGAHGDSEYVWIIDPLDGTSNYLRGWPFFGVSIAQAFRGRIILGVTYLPVTNELFWAAKDKGSFLNDSKIKVSEKDNLKETLTFFEMGKSAQSRVRLSNLFKNFLPGVSLVKKLGSSVYSLSLIAKGEAEVMLDIEGKIWDVAAGLLIIEEAGGRITDLGNPVWSVETKDFVATNSKLHESVLKILK
jgi:myo-inositol-1(or 4)-monophosphatase